MAQAVTVPWRDGDQTRYEDIAAIHAALRADRQRERDDAELLEHVRLDMLPPPFVDVLDAARAAGLSADVHHGGYRIHLPDGPPVDVDVRDLQPNIEELALHRFSSASPRTAYAAASPHGGFRVPADDPE